MRTILILGFDSIENHNSYRLKEKAIIQSLFTIFSGEGRWTLTLPDCSLWYILWPKDYILLDKLRSDAHFLVFIYKGYLSRNTCWGTLREMLTVHSYFLACLPEKV